MIWVSKWSGSDLVIAAGLGGFAVLTDEYDGGKYECDDDEAADGSQEGFGDVIHKSREKV